MQLNLYFLSNRVVQKEFSTRIYDSINHRINNPHRLQI